MYVARISLQCATSTQSKLSLLIFTFLCSWEHLYSQEPLYRSIYVVNELKFSRNEFLLLSMDEFQTKKKIVQLYRLRCLIFETAVGTKV